MPAEAELEPMPATRPALDAGKQRKDGLEGDNSCLKLENKWFKEFANPDYVKLGELSAKLNDTENQCQRLEADRISVTQTLEAERKVAKRERLEVYKIWEALYGLCDQMITEVKSNNEAARRLQRQADAQATELADLGIQCVSNSEGACATESEYGSPVSVLQTRIQELEEDRRRAALRLEEVLQERIDQNILLKEAEERNLHLEYQNQELWAAYFALDDECENYMYAYYDVNYEAMMMEDQQLELECLVQDYERELRCRTDEFLDLQMHHSDLVSEARISKGCALGTTMAYISRGENESSLRPQLRTTEDAQEMTKSALRGAHDKIGTLEASPPRGPKSTPMSPSTAASYDLLDDEDIPELRLPSPVPKKAEVLLPLPQLQSEDSSPTEDAMWVSVPPHTEMM
ncbi:hypothetical protein F5Y19DRAFT_282124 [Xylariaceae sp. FL1651]|nr:hypothetical protein F5Y19DRAFT_282124 [Xylariaceae sp. FL1651]